MANKHLRRLRPAHLFSSSSFPSRSKPLQKLKPAAAPSDNPSFINHHRLHQGGKTTAGMRQFINCLPLPLPGVDAAAAAGGYQPDDDEEGIMISQESHGSMDCAGDLDLVNGFYEYKRKRSWKTSLHRSHSCSKLKLVPSIKSFLSHHHHHHHRPSRLETMHELGSDVNQFSTPYMRSRSLPSSNKFQVLHDHVDAFVRDDGSSKINNHCKYINANHSHTPKGHVAVYVNYGANRVVVPISYLSHPDFQPLLLKTQDEFGFCQKAGLTLPCSLVEFHEVVSRIKTSNIHHHGHKHHPITTNKLIPQRLHTTFGKSNVDKLTQSQVPEVLSRRSLRSPTDISMSFSSTSPSSRGKGA